MLYRILLMSVLFVGTALADTPATGPSTPILEPDPTVMDAVVDSAMKEIRLVHSSIFWHRHRWRKPRSSIIFYYSSTPRYRSYYIGSGYSAAKRRCDRRYRSYNWRTDRFTTYSGKKKLCPYVRPYY